MSLHFSWLICGVLLLELIPPLLAQTSVQFVGLTNRTAPDAGLPAVFGKREEGINLDISGAAAQTGSLRADMFQVAGGLAIPLAKDIHILESLSLPDTSAHRVRVSLKFPDVKKQAEILLRLTLVQNPPQTGPVPLGDLRFDVFPESVTKELIDLLRPKSDADASIVLFGSGQKLRHFLAGFHVPFEDAGTDTPDRFDPNRLYFGELSNDQQFEEARDHIAGARLVLFSPDDSLPTGVYADRSPSGVLIHITLPLLENLADDPRSQLALIKIIHLLSAPPPSPN